MEKLTRWFFTSGLTDIMNLPSPKIYVIVLIIVLFKA